ncbi:ATP synthase F1 subunit delta [Companilactobacillus alimentarius]|uniref:ATP synthase subunit delta n=1 Tax=Companilactobacillus alimentarius DSM 20249 TaxID=1423720 RepID=A0A2K9HLZ5_9LACO|nr:ATP synthase F1 subunit delta [Companilactobacillus alimentarius]AUI70943.1 F0F1 ATP synthase subunit delta [Companilactobacillus alimentarius DSM 20249]GEO44170.1 ATP synthase subunit delta [Companilactobacillus alimentarius]
MKLSNKQVGKRYSKALFEVAEEQNSVEEMLEDLKALKQVYEENPGLGFALAGRSISRTEKLKILDTLKEKFSTLMQDFLGLVFDNNRMDCIIDIADAYIRKYDEVHGIVEASVTTAIKIDDSQASNLKSVIKKRFSVNEVNLTKIVDSNIIGGVIIRVGDQIVDGSVIKRFNDIKNSLLVNN